MTFRTAHLSPEHYASKWEIATGETLNDVRAVNDLAIEYATLPDGPAKEEKCLQIVRCFHGYLMKYLNMIIRGHLPSLKTPAGKDASKMLSTLLPKGEKATRENLLKACRSMHLAFKQQSADDVYDTLVLCLMRAIRKYDPHYVGKVKVICEAIDEKFPSRKRGIVQFGEPEITDTVGFASLSYIRLLVRRGHLASIIGPKKKVVGYERTKNWPPEADFFESGPVGFVYFLPMYFRYYVHEYISGTMGDLESQEHVLQLEHRTFTIDNISGDTNDFGLPHAEGTLVDARGNTWAADLSLTKLPLDVSEMTEAWVRHTNDRLFRKLTREERLILFLHYVRELKWIEIAAYLDCDVQTVRKRFDEIMEYLKARAQAKERYAT